MIDALAFEPHFLAHLAPVWRALSPSLRGTFYVEERNPPLVADALARGIAATGKDGMALRSSSPPPRASLADGPIALVASIGDTKVARRMGYRRFIFLEHGAAQSYSGTGTNPLEASYSGGPDRDDTILFLVPNEQAADRWRKTYPQIPAAVVGCPKLDDLPHRDGGDPAPVVAISFHWSVPGSLPPEAGNAMADFLPALPALSKRFRMIGHAHPRHATDMQKHYRRAGIEFVPSFEEVCRRADVYVCDNSSTIFEFASTNRPVVLMNSRYYRKNVSHGLRFWGAATVGLQVDPVMAHGMLDAEATTASLIDAIERSLEDPLDLQVAREAALAEVYQPRTNAAAYAATAITDLLSVAAAA